MVEGLFPTISAERGVAEPLAVPPVASVEGNSAVHFQRRCSSLAQDRRDMGALRTEVLPAYQNIISTISGHWDNPSAANLARAVAQTLEHGLTPQEGEDTLGQAKTQLTQLAGIVQGCLAKQEAKAECFRVMQAVDLIEKERLITQLGNYLKDVVKFELGGGESPRPTNGLKALLARVADRAGTLNEGATDLDRTKSVDRGDVLPAELDPLAALTLDALVGGSGLDSLFAKDSDAALTDELATGGRESERVLGLGAHAQGVEDAPTNPSTSVIEQAAGSVTGPGEERGGNDSEVGYVAPLNVGLPPPEVTNTPPTPLENPTPFVGAQSIAEALRAAPGQQIELCNGIASLSLRRSKVVDGDAICLKWCFGQGVLELELTADLLESLSFKQLKLKLEAGITPSDAAVGQNAGSALQSRLAKELFGTCAVTRLACAEVLKDLALPPILLTPGAEIELTTENCTGGIKVAEGASPSNVNQPVIVRSLTIKGAGDFSVFLERSVIEKIEVEKGAFLAGCIDHATLTKGACKFAGRLTELKMHGLQESTAGTRASLAAETCREMFEGARVRFSNADTMFRDVSVVLTRQQDRQDVVALNTERLSLLDRRIAQAFEGWRADVPVLVPTGEQVLMDAADEVFLAKALKRSLRGLPREQSEQIFEMVKTAPIVIPAVPLSFNERIEENPRGYVVFNPSTAEGPVVMGVLTIDRDAIHLGVRGSEMSKKLGFRLDNPDHFSSHSQMLADLYARRLFGRRPRWMILEVDDDVGEVQHL